MNDQPHRPEFRGFGHRLEAVKLRFEAGKNEHMALVILGDEEAILAHRQKMHDLMDVFLDIATEATTLAKMIDGQ